MININVLNGFEPRFRHALDCNDVTIPTVDNSHIECEELISTNCVVTAKSYNFFGIGVSETVTSAIDKIMTKMKAINEKSLKTGRGVAVFTQLTEPTQTDFNTEYGSVDGFGVNKITGANTFRPGDIWIQG
jgi:hypothetical protein